MSAAPSPVESPRPDNLPVYMGQVYELGDLALPPTVAQLGDANGSQQSEGLLARIGLDAMGEQERPVSPTWQELQASGDEAYDQAWKRQQDHGLDEETVALYKKADADLLGVTWWGPANMPPNRDNMLKRAESLGWLAKAMKPAVFYEDHGSHHIDMKSNLQELAQKELQDANAISLSEDSSTAEAPADQMTDIPMAEIIGEAAVEAAEEAGTDEHVVVRGIGKVDDTTLERLEAGGEEALSRFIIEHGMDPENGAMFTAITAHKARRGIRSTPARSS
jgi:hypothetical protein